MWETRVRSLGWEDPLEKGKATHSSILAWRIPWTMELQESDTTERLSLSHIELNTNSIYSLENREQKNPYVLTPSLGFIQLVT